MTFAAPGLKVAAIELIVADAMEFDTGTPVKLTQIDQAISSAGQAAVMWGGIDWWWAKSKANFRTITATIATIANDGARRTSNVSTITTTAAHGLAVGQTVQVADVTDTTFNGTFVIASVTATTFTYLQAGDNVGATTAGTGTVFPRSYPARTVDVAGATSGTAVMADLWSIRRMFYDDQWVLFPWNTDQYELTERLFDTASRGTPTNYYFDGSFIFLYPTPSSQFNIYVHYIRQHAAITGASSTSSDLIVPGEHHMQIYADGAIWMLRHGVVDPAALAGSPQFQSTMVRMLASAPNKYDSLDTSGDQIGIRPGMFPNDRRIVATGDGGFLIGNEVSL